MIFIILSETFYSLFPNPTKFVSLLGELNYNCNYNLNLLNKNIFTVSTLFRDKPSVKPFIICCKYLVLFLPSFLENEDLCAPYNGQQWVESRWDWPLGDSLLRYPPLLPLSSRVEGTEGRVLE